MEHSSNLIKFMKESNSMFYSRKFELVSELDRRSDHNLFDDNCTNQNLLTTKK